MSRIACCSAMRNRPQPNRRQNPNPTQDRAGAIAIARFEARAGHFPETPLWIHYAGLALEPRHALGIPREGFRQNLNRHVNAPKVKH